MSDTPNCNIIKEQLQSLQLGVKEPKEIHIIQLWFPFYWNIYQFWSHVT